MDEINSNNCSEKMVFDSQKEAETTATVAMYQHGTRLKVYRCRECQLWHLSSRREED